MLSGRAVIAAGLPDTELWYLIEKSGCGWLVPPDDPQALSQAIMEARNAGAAELNRRGEAGRAYALKNWSAANNLSQLINIVENGAKSKK
jgi:glycosyltransferase involved in cell wall biosynthesis